jgi:hypothetical protein
MKCCGFEIQHEPTDVLTTYYKNFILRCSTKLVLRVENSTWGARLVLSYHSLNATFSKRIYVNYDGYGNFSRAHKICSM